MVSGQKPPITDSAWFWVLIFSLMALVALAAMSGKYSRRQANIERQYQARDRVAKKLAAENNPTEAERIDDSTAQRAYATPGDQLIPLWPLAILLSLIAIIAGGMLYRSRGQGRGRPGSLEIEDTAP